MKLDNKLELAPKDEESQSDLNTRFYLLKNRLRAQAFGLQFIERMLKIPKLIQTVSPRLDKAQEKIDRLKTEVDSLNQANHKNISAEIYSLLDFLNNRVHLLRASLADLMLKQEAEPSQDKSTSIPLITMTRKSESAAD